MFDIGAKVVCINDTFPPAILNYMKNLPKKGSVYTVRDIIPANDWNGGETAAVLLAEVRNAPAPHRKQWGECGFAVDRFRELDELTDEERAAIAEKEPAVK